MISIVSEFRGVLAKDRAPATPSQKAVVHRSPRGPQGSLGIAHGIPKQPLGVLEAHMPKGSYLGIPWYAPRILRGPIARAARAAITPRLHHVIKRTL